MLTPVASECGRMGNGVTGATTTFSPLLLLVLGLLCHGSMASDSDQMHQLTGAMVVGAVYCDTCFQQQSSKASHFISGAVVAVECGGEDAAAKPTFRQEARTNGHGVFRVHLPPFIGKHLKNILACSVKLIGSGEPFCSVAASATSTSLRLRSRKNGVHVFSAGFFTFKPLQQPEFCYQEPSLTRSSQLGSSLAFGIPFPNPPSIFPPTQPKDLSPSTTAPAMDRWRDQAIFLQPPPTPSMGGLLPSPSRPFQPPDPIFEPPSSSLPSLPLQPPPSYGLPLPQPTPPSFYMPAFPFPSFPSPSIPFFPGTPDPSLPSAGGRAAP